MQKPDLQADRAKLNDLMFNRAKVLDGYLAEVHAAMFCEKYKDHYNRLDTLRKIIFSPYTSQYPDFEGMIAEVLRQLKTTGTLDEVIAATVDNYAELPPESALKMIAKKEASVKVGNYDPFLKPSAISKFDAKLEELINDPKFKEALAGFLKRHKETLSKLREDKLVIRRRMCMERNFRPPGWKFTYETLDDKLQVELESLCNRFCLYGLEKTNGEFTIPLLQKLTVNAYPFGIMIVIPRYWSLDYKRDIIWSEVTRLLRSWEMPRQGVVMSVMRTERQKRALRCLEASREAKRRGLVSTDYIDFIIEDAELNPNTDEREVRQLVKDGERLEKGKTTKRKRGKGKATSLGSKG